MERNISEWNTIGPQIDAITLQNGIKSVRLTDSKIVCIIFLSKSYLSSYNTVMHTSLQVNVHAI